MRERASSDRDVAGPVHLDGGEVRRSLRRHEEIAQLDVLRVEDLDERVPGARRDSDADEGDVLRAVENHVFDPHARPPDDPQRTCRPRRNDQPAVGVRLQPDRAAGARQSVHGGLELLVVSHADRLARGGLGRRCPREHDEGQYGASQGGRRTHQPLILARMIARAQPVVPESRSPWPRGEGEGRPGSGLPLHRSEAAVPRTVKSPD